jgi:superfamily II DNA or RNA helicase
MPKKTPRPHQKKAIKAVVHGFQTHDRGKLVMACGTGKTLIAGWIREAMKAGCTLFMAPSNALLAQTLQAWREVSKTPFEALAVCSDASVANGRDEDDLPTANVGAAVTTDYQHIATFISSTGPRVVLCTYQSSEALAAAMSLVSVPAFDLAIADEAHRTTGGSGHLFPTIVHPEKIRATKKLFMTATPRFYFDDGDDEIVSMDNEEHYGPVFHELDFAEAIKLGLLTDYEVLVVGVSPDAEKEAMQLLEKNPRLKVADRKMTARNLAVNIAILRTIKERGLERIITFHNSCSKASAAADFLPLLHDWMPSKYRAADTLWARTVNHTMDISDRHELLRQFVALKGPGILTNARCLGEGVDVPTVDAVAFMDAKKSKTEIAQTVGRAIRLSPGKTKSYIILPVIMLPGDDPEQINSKSFKPAFDVINALRAHDSTLMDQLQHWKDRGSHGERGQTGGDGGDGGRKITFDIPAECDPDIAGWFICRVCRRPTAWEHSYSLAMQEAKSGKITNKTRAWLLAQRRNSKSGCLTIERQTLVAPLFSLLGRVNNMIERSAGILKLAIERGFRDKAASRSALACRAKYPTLSAAVLSLPTPTGFKRRRELSTLADQFDTLVRENGVRPALTSPALPHRFWAWVLSAEKNPSELQGIRSKTWLRRLRTIPTDPVKVTEYRSKAAAKRDLRIAELLQQLAAFRVANGRFPRSSGATEHETRLSTLARNKMHYAERRGASAQAEALREALGVRKK